MPAAISTAVAVARELGFAIEQPVSLRSTNNVVAWLRPAVVLAKVSRQVDSHLLTELRVAQELVALGAPVVSPASEVPAIVRSSRIQRRYLFCRRQTGSGCCTARLTPTTCCWSMTMREHAEYHLAHAREEVAPLLVMFPDPRAIAFMAALSVLVAGTAQAADAPQPADVLIHGGLVYTGDAVEPGVLDVVITGDTITYVGDDAASRFRPARTIEANGKIVAPGFIDPHTHPDTYIRSQDPAQRHNAPWLMQGVTTIAIGVDGGGDPEISKQRSWFEERGVGTNLAPYVGFSRVRESVLGQAARAPSKQELDRMRGLVAKAMCEGAFGFSTGLFYAPQSFATTDEVVAVAHEAAIRGGIYDTHQRDESSYGIGLLDSTREAIDIGRRAGMPVHISHLKALGVDVHGKSKDLVAIIDAARASGLNVTANQYPFIASGSSLQASLLPRWSVDGGRPALLERLSDSARLPRIRSEMSENLRRRGGADSLLFNSVGQPWSGKTLAAMSTFWKLEPVDAALRIIREADDDKSDSVTSFNMSEDDVQVLMQQSWVVTGSDGSDGHPRQYATFPEKYAKYVQREHVLTTAEFIRRSTGATADILGLERRGYLRVGSFADIVVLDPSGYRPRADYLHPDVLSEGVLYVWVNGTLAVDVGKMTDALSGRVLSHAPTAGSCRSSR